MKHMKPAMGDLILTKECNKGTPFMIGEEACLLGTNSPFTIVAKTDITIISFEVEMFFTIMKHIDAESL